MGDDGRWEKLSSKKLLETPFFTLRSDRLRLPDGVVKEDYYVIERRDAVFIVPITARGEVLLVRQYRPPLEQMELCVPAGLIEEGEDPLEAAKRELLEETGHGGGDWEFVARLSSSPGLKNNWAHVFLARGVEEISSLDLDEFERLEVERAPVEKLESLIRAGEIVSASGVAAILLSLKRL